MNDGLIDEKRGKSQTNTFISDDVIDATKIKVDARIGTNMWHGVVDMDITRVSWWTFMIHCVKVVLIILFFL